MEDISGFLDGFKRGEPVLSSKKSPYDFLTLSYDDRKGSAVDAGTRYGPGKPQPVGRVGNAKARVDALPFGKVKTMKVDEC